MVGRMEGDGRRSWLKWAGQRVEWKGTVDEAG